VPRPASPTARNGRPATRSSKLARATADIGEFFADLAAGTLPAVSWIVTEAVVSERPPAPPDMGQLLAARVVEAMMASSAWDSSVLFLTYDEGGGFFDHVPPAVLETVPSALPDAGEAVGPGFRVPLSSSRPRRGRAASTSPSPTTLRSCNS
jgi:phospholipase C